MKFSLVHSVLIPVTGSIKRIEAESGCQIEVPEVLPPFDCKVTFKGTAEGLEIAETRLMIEGMKFRKREDRALAKRWEAAEAIWRRR